MKDRLTAPTDAVANPFKGFRATLHPEKAEFKTNLDAKVICSFKNTSDAALQLDTSVFNSAILSLEVLDADGKQLPTVPPPFPVRPEDRGKYLKTVEPGNEYEIAYSLYMFSPPLKPGIYSVRTKGIESNTVKVNILDPRDK